MLPVAVHDLPLGPAGVEDVKGDVHPAQAVAQVPLVGLLVAPKTTGDIHIHVERAGHRFNPDPARAR